MPPRALRPAIVLAAAGAVPLALAAVLAPRPPDAAAVSPELRTVVRGSGDIAPTVQRFRSLLGPDNGGAPGSRATGRREINWDAVPDRLARPALLPGDFFNASAAPRARGALLRTPGRGVAVSADAQNAAGAAPRFADLNPSYAAEFRTFSPQRLFSPIGSNVVNLRFVVPGTLRRATVRASAPSTRGSTAGRTPRSSTSTPRGARSAASPPRSSAAGSRSSAWSSGPRGSRGCESSTATASSGPTRPAPTTSR